MHVFEPMWQANYVYPILNRLAIYAIILLSLMHIAGVIGLGLETSRWLFQALTPFSLWTTGLLLILFQENKNAAFWRFALFAFGLGFGSEVLGVHTGLIFGDYAYGATLGLKVWEVPLTIGLNWLVLVIGTGYLSSRLAIPGWLKSAIGAALMVAFDFVMEPVAMALDFWDWSNSEIPLQNYMGWFGVAYLIQLSYHYGRFSKYNFLAGPVLLLQLLFFSALNFWVS